MSDSREARAVIEQRLRQLNRWLVSLEGGPTDLHDVLDAQEVVHELFTLLADVLGSPRLQKDERDQDARVDDTQCPSKPLATAASSKPVSSKERPLVQIMKPCEHFTGVQHDACKAGIKYADFQGVGKLPCLQMYADGATCAKGQFPTREQVERKYSEQEAVWAKHALAHRAAHDDAKVKKFGKGHGGADSVACPVCTTGQIYYRVAAYNGHMHAKCETDGCVSWME